MKVEAKILEGTIRHECLRRKEDCAKNPVRSQSHLNEFGRPLYWWFTELKSTCVKHPQVVGSIDLKSLNRKQRTRSGRHCRPIEFDAGVGDSMAVFNFACRESNVAIMARIRNEQTP
jgi:hypothetical protein